MPFTIDDNWQTVSIATYSQLTPQPAPLTINGFDKPIKTAPIANLDALAINALKEELPAALVRQALRVAAKSEMARSVRSESKRRNDEIDYGAIAMQIFNVVSEQADRRSWLTLPQQAQIARQYVNAGNYTVNLGQNQTTNVSVEPNRTTLIWMIDTGNRTRFYSIIL